MKKRESFVRKCTLRCILILLLAHSSHSAFSQTNDAQVWENIYIEKNLSTKLYAHFNHEGRITENSSHFGYGYADAGISYKISKMVHLTADYVFVIKDYTDNRISYRHQYYIANTIKKKFKPLVFYWRLMYQVEYDDIYSTENGKIGDVYLRNKFTLKYKELGRFIPYTATEFYYNADNDRKYGMQFDRTRTYVGVFYELNKIDQLEAYAMLEKHFQVKDPQTNYVFGIGYNHLFY